MDKELAGDKRGKSQFIPNKFVQILCLLGKSINET